jgi:hypothetical protein
MSEGRRIARKYNKKGSQVGNLLNPVRGIRDRQARQGRAVVNHARENIRNMRATQAKNRALQDAKNKPKAKKFVMKRFKDVKSRWVKPDVKERDRKKEEYVQKRTEEIATARLKNETARRDLATARRAVVQSENNDPAVAPSALAAPSSPILPSLSTSTAGRRSPGTNKPRVPRRNEITKLAPRSKKDFVQANLIAAITQKSPRREDAANDQPQVHEDYGVVPVYIQEIKATMAEQKQAEEEKAEREKGCPPGMTRMSEQERIETLEVLKKNKLVGYAELAKLPMTIETPSLVKRKNGLERKLEQIEEAIKIFSRSVVWVQEDA